MKYWMADGKPQKEIKRAGNFWFLEENLEKEICVFKLRGDETFIQL